MSCRISLVIPCHNAAKTIAACLDAVTASSVHQELDEIIVVDDGSMDGTAAIVARYPVRYLAHDAQGPGAARNAGWRASSGELVWFLDADCLVQDETLDFLKALLTDETIAGVSGSYENQETGSRLACLIQAEIAARHKRMRQEVGYLAGFNVLYRRSALAAVGGFDETDLNGPGAAGAEDIELSARLVAHGYRLCFERRSRVLHYHQTQWRAYLSAQYVHGYWRVRFYCRYPGRVVTDGYSTLVDHVQPPLAVVLTVSLIGSVFMPRLFRIAAWAWWLLFAAQVPMTLRMTASLGREGLWYVPFNLIRTVARACIGSLLVGKRLPVRRI